MKKICLIFLRLSLLGIQPLYPLSSLYTDTADLEHYLFVKTNKSINLTKEYSQHLKRFPNSPFKNVFNLIKYDANVKALFLKKESLLLAKNRYHLKTSIKKSLSYLSNGIYKFPGTSSDLFNEYANWKQFTTNEIGIFKTLLFAHVAIYGKTKSLINPYRQHFNLYKEQCKEKTSENWQSDYTKYIKTLNLDIENIAWYTYKISEFSMAYHLYSNIIEEKQEGQKKQKKASHWFYLGVSSFYLSKYKESQKSLKRFLDASRDKKKYSKFQPEAYYHYYRCFDKLRTGRDKLPEIHRYCRKHPREKMYRVLLRMAKRHQYPDYESIVKEFFRHYPNSHTAYLKRREKAFAKLNRGDTSGLALLKNAYGSPRKRIYQEIVHWQYTNNPQIKADYFARGDNWFTDYFYQKAKDSKSKKLWQKWMSSLKSKIKTLTDETVAEYKVFYWKNEKQKWKWFEASPWGYGANDTVRHWASYTNRIETFVRFGYAGTMEGEIKKNFRQSSKERLFFLRALYDYSSNTHKMVLLYERDLKAHGDLMGGIPHALYKYTYPLYRYKEVKTLSKRHGVPAALVYAVMRAESFYKEDAISFAGAIGLMQIMPATGQWIFNKTKMNEQYKFDLFSPQVNLEIGVRFLSDLYKQFDGNVILASAAYNAGGGSVKKWLKNKKTDDWIHFSHFIPYDQTERYVRKVVRNLQAYRTLYPFL